MTTDAPLPSKNASSPTWMRRDSNGVLLAGSVLFLALFLRLWPQGFTSMDESAYINMAAVLRHGTVYPDVAGVSVVTVYPFSGHMICKYPLGMPALLAAVSLMGWRLTLATNLVVHLLTFLLVIRLLRRLDIPAGFALLYLLYPTAVLYSRTLMADPFSGLLLALAFDQYLSRHALTVGALIGLAVNVRTGNALAAPVFLVALLLEREGADGQLRRRLSRAALLIAGAAPFLLLALYYARVIAGGQMAQHTGTFSLSYFPRMFPGYVLGLMLLYPGMLIAPALYRGRGRTIIVGLCYSFLMLYSFWYYRDSGSSWAESLIVGMRYFLAVLPLWIVAYSAVCWRVMQHWSQGARSALASVAVLILFCLAAGISVRHAHYVARLADVRTRLLRIVPPGDTLICNVQIAKLFYPGATHTHLLLTGDLLPAEDVLNFKRTAQSILGHPGGRVYLAAWARPGRRDDMASAETLSRLARLLGALPLAAQVRNDLPPEVAIFKLDAPGPEAVPAATSSAATSAPSS